MTLDAVLMTCRELSAASEDALFSSNSIGEIVAILNRGISCIQSGTELNRDELKLLFAPTGALQETAIQNGWSAEYRLLSQRFDSLIE